MNPLIAASRVGLHPSTDSSVSSGDKPIDSSVFFGAKSIDSSVSFVDKCIDSSVSFGASPPLPRLTLLLPSHGIIVRQVYPRLLLLPLWWLPAWRVGWDKSVADGHGDHLACTSYCTSPPGTHMESECLWGFRNVGIFFVFHCFSLLFVAFSIMAAFIWGK